EDREEVAADQARLERFAAFGPLQARGRWLDKHRRDTGERRVAIPVIRERDVREVVEAATVLRAADVDDAIGMSDARWVAQEERIRQRIDRGRATDADGDGEDCRDGEDRTPEKT